MANTKHVARLRESLSQLKGFKAAGITAYSPEFKAWTERTHRTLHELFGASQYLRAFGNLHFCEPRVHFAARGNSRPQWLPMDQNRFDSDAVEAEQLLADAIEDVDGPPNSDDSDSSPSMTDAWQLIHPAISEVARTRFEDGHYADAAETAFKAVNMRVKAKWKAAGHSEKDGKTLMLSAFSVKQPTIRLDDLSTESGQNIQEGYMHIFAGAIQAIRNPKAHEIITITPARAMHFLVLASLLMFKLDEAAT
jgi:uncharacterized protein (TIGR02391 family)